MAKATLESGLRKHLAAKAKLNAKEKRILRVLDLPNDSQRKQRLLERMEDTARGQAGVSKIDWSNFDWDKFLAFIMKLLALFGI